MNHKLSESIIGIRKNRGISDDVAAVFAVLGAAAAEAGGWSVQ
ncbi:MAG: hypothetical protein ACQEXX_03630 [Bacillota bacterium]